MVIKISFINVVCLVFLAEYPWQVAILKKEQFDNVYVCGGSLVDGSHILTAAHCIKSYRPEDLRIRLGEWDVNNDSGEILVAKSKLRQLCFFKLLQNKANTMAKRLI